MTDRVPGAPGQYKAVITAEELQKMQAGERFTITMTRDDQPITVGTPYSKDAVLPDELAKIICPDVLDPSPADAFRGLLPLAGGTMKGALNMGGQPLKGLAEPKENGDAVPKEYVVPKTGGTFNGPITISLGKSKGFVTITEDVEGGTIQLGSPNGTYVYEIDAPGDDEIRVHTKSSPSGVEHQQFSFSGKTGEIRTNKFSTKVYKTSSGTGFDALKAFYPSLPTGIILVDAIVGTTHLVYLVEKANNSYGSAIAIGSNAFANFKLAAGKWTAIEK